MSAFQGLLSMLEEKLNPKSAPSPSLGGLLGVAITAAAQPPPLYMAPGPTKGLVSPGTIDLRQLAPINNGDGTWSTVNSASFNDEEPSSPTYGKEVLVRGILGGKRIDPGDPRVLRAMKQEYYRTGRHLGVFDNGDNADAYATRLHNDWQAGKIPGVKMFQGGNQ